MFSKCFVTRINIELRLLASGNQSISFFFVA